MTFQHTAQDPAPLAPHISAAHSNPAHCRAEEARLRVTADLAARGLLAVASDCLRSSSQHSPEPTVAQLAVYGGCVTSLAEANVRQISSLEIVMRAIRRSSEKSAAQMSKRVKRALAECIESAELLVHDYKVAPPFIEGQSSVHDALVLHQSASLVMELIVLLGREAALVLSMLRLLPSHRAKYVWLVVATFLRSGSDACLAIEEAAMRGVSDRDELLHLIECSLRSRDLERLGPFGVRIASETLSNLRETETSRSWQPRSWAHPPPSVGANENVTA